MSFHEHDKIGFWGPVTSTLDWCEVNYEVSPYIAEFWNTISNVVMIIPPLIGMWYVRNQEFRFIVCYFSVMCVGLGSWLFHMTLLYSMQLADELPMVAGTAVLIYALLELDKPSRLNFQLFLVLLVYCSGFAVIYLILRQPLIHQVAYGLLVVSSLMASFRVVVKYRRHTNLSLFFLSLLSYLIGFILWNIDTIFCHKLRHWRTTSMAPSWRPVLQLHAWWHILAGVSTYVCLLVTIDIRLRILKRKAKLTWCGPLPVVHSSDGDYSV